MQKKLFLLLGFVTCFAMEKSLQQSPLADLPKTLQQLIMQRYGIQQLKYASARQALDDWEKEQVKSFTSMHAKFVQGLLAYEQQTQLNTKKLFDTRPEYIEGPEGSFFSHFYIGNTELLMKYNSDGTFDKEFRPIPVCIKRDESQHSEIIIKSNGIWIYKHDKTSSSTLCYNFNGNCVSATGRGGFYDPYII